MMILIIIVAVIAAFAIGGGIAAGKANEKAAGLEYFTIGPDEVPSVMKVLGEQRKITKFNTGKSNGVDILEIKYEVDKEQGYDLSDYINVLDKDYNFKSLKPYDFNEPTGSEIEFAAKSKEDGYIIKLTIDYDEKGYSLTFRRGEGTLTIYGGQDDEEDEPAAPAEEEEDEPAIEEEEEDEPAPPKDEEKVIKLTEMYSNLLGEDSLKKDSENLGYTYEKNSDGTFTLYMTEEQQDKKLDNVAQNTLSKYVELLTQDIGVVDVEYNNDYSEITILCESRFFDNKDTVAETYMMVSAITPMYQLFQGKGEDAKSTVHIKNEDTGEEVETFTAPEKYVDM